MTIAVQAAIGDAGSKPVTEFTNFNFSSTGEVGGVPIGANADGLFRLNDGEADNGSAFTRSFTLSSTDFGQSNPKRIRFVYIGIKFDSDATLSVKVDEQTARPYTIPANKTGLQRVRVPIGRDGQGRYWTVRISSTEQFKVDDIKVIFYSRSSGIVGY